MKQDMIHRLIPEARTFDENCQICPYIGLTNEFRQQLRAQRAIRVFRSRIRAQGRVGFRHFNPLAPKDAKPL
jgi:hypothetical protein